MRLLIFVLISANLLTYFLVWELIFQKPAVIFFDVGQGNSVLLKSKNNFFLYDTGKYPSLLTRNLDQFLPFYSRKIDLLFLSHPDIDHYGGTKELLKRYEVRLIVVSSLNSSEKTYLEILNLAKEKNIPIITLKRGDKIFDNHFTFLVLNPQNNFLSDNNSSLVLKIKGKHSYLLLGDLEKRGIKDLISCCRDLLKSDFFLVPHHGSRSSLDENLYAFVSPKMAIISVGKNRYGHPHKEVLKALLKYTPNIWRTDLKGHLIIEE